MTGRVYLDWNATAPLRPEARAAMLAAMDVVGNPSSVHGEGRAAWAIVERARAQVAGLVGCDPDAVVFTSGATEANAIPLRCATVAVTTATAHPSLHDDRDGEMMATWLWSVLRDGRHAADPVSGAVHERGPQSDDPEERLVRLCMANGETGVLNKPAELLNWLSGQVVHVDAAQAAGRTPLGWRETVRAAFRLSMAVSAHKLGGPAGVGALVGSYVDLYAFQPGAGGGQERGVRAGTQNVAGIAGFGAAAEAAARDLEAGVWERVATLRDSLEGRLADAAPDAIIVGQDAGRLPNTTCVIVPGWRGETQVLQLDLAGFAVSAGAACSSGKVGPSRVLTAMGYDDVAAASAIRVSLGWTTTETDIARFADAWRALYARRRPAAA